MTNQSLVRTKSGRQAGRIENRIFIKELYGSKHMLRCPIAWAIDADIFDSVISNLCDFIHVIDRENGKRYAVSVKTFREFKGVLDRGYGKQYYLDLVYWRVS